MKEIALSKLNDDVKQKRIFWIDILRGFAMFLVIYGHTSQNTEIKNYIYAFHMPLFFIISGMTTIFSKEIPTKEFLKKKLKTLIIPYFLLNMIMLPLSCFNGHIGAIKNFSIPQFLIGTLYSNNLGSYDAPSNATWFITTLFLVELLFYILKKFLKTEKDLMFGIGIIGIIGYVNSIAKYKYHGPWHIQVVLTAIVFFYIGYMFMKNITFFKSLFNTTLKTIITAIFLFVIGIYFASVNTRVSLTADKYGSMLYFYIAALSLSFSLVIVFMKMFDKDLKITKYIGQNSILWLAMQIPMIRYLQKVYPIFKQRERYAFLLAVIIYIAIIPTSLIINKFLLFIVGKKYKKKASL